MYSLGFESLKEILVPEKKKNWKVDVEENEVGLFLQALCIGLFGKERELRERLGSFCFV